MLLLALVAGSGRWAAAQEAAPAQAARAAAETWLALLDSARYRESWAATAAAFRLRVSEATWDSTMRVHRAPLGSVRSRELLGAQHTTALPGAPPGEYVVLQYRTEFAGRDAPAVETVVPMKEDHGWRVSGYFIR